VSTDDQTQIDPLATTRVVRMERRFDAPPARLYRCWTDPEEIVRWFPEAIEGSLALNTRSVLVFPRQRVWWDVTVLEPDRTFEFRWPWLKDESVQTTVRVELSPLGYGSHLALADGPFDLRLPGVIDAYSEAREGWAEALAWLRGWVDFSVELRPRRY
jgi:uncharacterized protein YndB with AHSA1/START domain